MSSRRILTIAAAVAGIVAIVAALSLGRDEQPPRALADRSRPSSSSAPSTPPARVLSGRDPFSPPPALLTRTSPTTPSVEDRAPDSSSPEPTDPGSPTPPPASTVPPPPPSDCGAARPSECRRVGPHVIELLRITERHRRPSVDLEVDGDLVANVRQGERFADGFKLVGFNDALCARIVFGDEGLTLCSRERRS